MLLQLCVRMCGCCVLTCKDLANSKRCGTSLNDLRNISWRSTKLVCSKDCGQQCVCVSTGEERQCASFAIAKVSGARRNAGTHLAVQVQNVEHHKNYLYLHIRQVHSLCRKPHTERDRESEYKREW